jgi:hypothetical protein
MESQQNAGETKVNQKKPLYKRWWFIVVAVVVFLMIVSSFGEDKGKEESQAKKENQANEQANIDNKIAERNQDSNPGTSADYGDVKKYTDVVIESVKSAEEGYSLSKNSAVFAASNNHSAALEGIGKAKKLYTKALKDLSSVSPPDKFKEMHELMVKGIEKFSQANTFMENGMNKVDVNSINRAGELLDEGNAIIGQAHKKFLQLNAK